MAGRFIDREEIDGMISAAEAERSGVAERLRALDERLHRLYAVRDFVTLGPESLLVDRGAPSFDAPPSGSSGADVLMASQVIAQKPSADASIAALVDYVLQLHSAEVKRTGQRPGMRPSEIGKEIERLFQRTVAAKPVNGRLWYLKSRNMVGWRENYYYLKDVEAPSASEAA
jgi:hypothetical protein